MIMDKRILKLILGLKFLVSRYELKMIDDALFLRLLKKYLKSFDISFSANDISSSQLRKIDSLVSDAAFRWQCLPDNALQLNDLSLSEAYNLGFIASVLHIMRIFGIDEKLVKR